MKKKKNLPQAIFLYTVGCFCILPAAVVVVRSFMPLSELKEAFHMIRRKWSLVHYDGLLFSDIVYFDCFWNSVKYVTAILILGLPVSLLSGYGLWLGRSRMKQAVFLLYVVLMLMPFQATCVPQYLMLRRLGILDTGFALVLPNAFSALGTVLVYQYMKGIDRCLYDAGRLDGLGHFSMLCRLFLPLCRPVVWCYLTMAFLDFWAMIEQPMFFIHDKSLYPLALELYGRPAESLLPGSVLFSVLPLLVYRLGGHSLEEGISLGIL